MIEAFLLEIGEDSDTVRMDFAIKKHMEWYKGDGIYGDGADFIGITTITLLFTQ